LIFCSRLAFGADILGDGTPEPGACGRTPGSEGPDLGLLGADAGLYAVA
jgi:hypothetical protein